MEYETTSRNTDTGLCDFSEGMNTAVLSYMCALSPKPDMAMANVIFVMDQLSELLQEVANFCCC